MYSRKREAHSDVKEENPPASDVEPLELADDKTFPSTSLPLESNCDPEHLQKEETELEDNSMEHSSENSAVQDGLGASSVEKELPLEEKEERGENPEKDTGTEIDEVDVTATEEAMSVHTGGIEEQDDNILEVQTEIKLSGELCVEPSSSASDTSGKPELLNFLGDWPVEQTMGQRVKRTRRLEKALNSDNEGKTPTQQHLELGEEQVSLTETCTIGKGCEEENLPSSSSSANSNNIMSELQMIEHWPVSGSLEQRQQRSRRMRKMSPNQPDEGKNAQGDIDRNALETLDVLHGTPEITAEPANTEGLHMHQPETVASETAGEKKLQQNKRMRKHHKLALTFANNLPHSKEEEHLSVLNSVEEKQDMSSCRQKSSYSQTESQDFALLWRLEKKMLFPETAKVLHGRLDGFKPKDVDNASESQEKIPYRVMYDRSTFVEENELINIDESEKLNMLCKLFESVSFEALKDLYERCNKDIDWATGLLLDSDEKLRKEVDTECFQVREAEPDGADLDFKTSTNSDENLKDHEQALQVTGAGDVSEPLEDKDSSISLAESRATKATVMDANASEWLAAASLNESAELLTSGDAALRTDAGSSAADITEPSVPGKQKTESETPVEETTNQPSVLQLHADFCMPMTFPHGPNTTSADLKCELDNESDHNSSESNAGDSTMTGSLLGMDHTSLIDPGSDKELEMPKEMQGSSREIGGKEEIRAQSWDEAKAKTQPSRPASRAAFSIDCLELTLPPELALQLKEIFGPVGIDAGMGLIISTFL